MYTKWGAAGHELGHQGPDRLSLAPLASPDPLPPHLHLPKLHIKTFLKSDLYDTDNR